MRIGLYGLPTAGKSYILEHISTIETLAGSSLLNKITPNFKELSDDDKAAARLMLAEKLLDKDDFIMDGHYSFGDKVVFTEADGRLYDTFIYLYINPKILEKRIKESDRNRKYLKYDIEQWQLFEIESLREYCHKNNKDFYVIDNPVEGSFTDINIIEMFIDNIIAGFSCVKFAQYIVNQMPEENVISLIDGDRTFIYEDSCAKLGYSTHTFDGNFYSGFQSWKHNNELLTFLDELGNAENNGKELLYSINEDVHERIEGKAFILTSGDYYTWKSISERCGMGMFFGQQMCADTKYFVAKFLKKRGSKVVAFGDSMNDYYMLKKADIGYLVRKRDGSISKSLINRELEGLVVV